MLGIVHVADTRDQAIDDCTYGLQDFSNYFGAAGFVPRGSQTGPAPTPRQFVEDYAAKGNCCIGTPADAIGYILDMLDRPESDNPGLTDLLSRRPVWAGK